MSTCTMFATFTQSLSRYLIIADPDLVARANAQATTSSSSTATAGGPGTSASAANPSSRTAAAQQLALQRSSKSAPYVYDPQRVDKMFDMLGKYEDNFARHLKILLDTLNYLAATETVVFLSLCARLACAGEGGMVSMAVEGFGV